MKRRNFVTAATLGLPFASISGVPARAADLSLLNVSYDPTRELYREMDRIFASAWRAKTGDVITVRTSNGGSGAQARSVMDGLAADVVTLALAYDIDALAARGLLAKDWAGRLPNKSVPTTSTIVFLVRRGNPKAVRDWADLVKPGVSIITPNPKTSGGARWNYLAAWGWALRQPGGSEATATEYLHHLFQQAPVLDTGARGATNSFVQRGLGDVLIAWENEALLAKGELGPDKFDIVYPSISILAEPPVAVVDSVVDKKGTRAAAQAYLEYLYTPDGQELAAKHYYRPRDAAVAQRHAATFPSITTFDVASLGGWTQVQAKHFADGGLFDKIYTPSK